MDYSYNIRGWLTDINNISQLNAPNQPQDLFAFKVSYDKLTSTNSPARPMYNGNISETSWRTSSDNIRRKYEYVYDGLDRLTDAWFGIPGSVLNVRNSYNEHLNYDLNGNITSLQRNGDNENPVLPVIMIDDLTYTYDTNSNRLVSVTDATNHPSGFTPSSTPLSQDAYEYDAFGNLTKDRHKGITNIIYNHLHQPKELFVSNGTQQAVLSIFTILKAINYNSI